MRLASLVWQGTAAAQVDGALKQLRCARVISAGHAFVQNIRRDHYELGTEEPTTLRVMVAFTELTVAI